MLSLFRNGGYEHSTSFFVKKGASMKVRVLSFISMLVSTGNIEEKK